jgi:hypothetical protein
MSNPASPAPSRQDPIRERYFKAVEIAESWSEAFFYIAALLSFVVLLIDRARHPVAFDIFQIAFAVVVLLLFVLGLAIRLHWMPIALDERRIDLLSHAYSIPLTHEQTTGYYNSNETDPLKRLGVHVMENSHFSRAIALTMAKTERVKVGIYSLILVVVWLNRSTDLVIAATAAQVVFSEQILSHWLRLEWFRIRCNTTYKHLYALFQGDPVKATLHAQALEWFAFYEAGKSNSGITLSEKIFQRSNDVLSREWEQIRATLKL